MVKPKKTTSPFVLCTLYLLQHLTGVATPLPKIGEVQNKILTDKKVFSGDLVGEWGSAIIRVCFVIGVVRNLLANKSVGVQDIAANLVLNRSGVKELLKQGKLTQENIGEQRTVAIDLSPIPLNVGTKSALIVVQQKICNLLTLNRFGLEVHINGQ